MVDHTEAILGQPPTDFSHSFGTSHSILTNEALTKDASHWSTDRCDLNCFCSCSIFLCEDEPTFKRLKDDESHQSLKQYIILCDRSSHMDTKKIEGTNSLHEVKSVATEIPTDLPKKWPLQTAHLPCRCKECEGDHEKECLFSPWRKPKEEYLEPIQVKKTPRKIKRKGK